MTFLDNSTEYYVVEATLLDCNTGLPKTYPIPFTALDKARDYFNHEIDSDDWSSVVLKYGDEIIDSVVNDDGGKIYAEQKEYDSKNKED